MGATDKNVRARRALERRIVLSAIKELHSHGFLLSVADSRPSSNKAAVLEAIMKTNEDYLSACNSSGGCIGWVHFVYGNEGWDVIADWSERMGAYIAKTNSLAEKLRPQTHH